MYPHIHLVIVITENNSVNFAFILYRLFTKKLKHLFVLIYLFIDFIYVISIIRSQYIQHKNV